MDVVFFETGDKTTISHWMPGTVTEFATLREYEGESEQFVESNWRFYVTYDNNLLGYPKQFERDSPYIAPPGTFTDDFQWRNEFKEGDLVDCVDRFGVWYRSTVL